MKNTYRHDLGVILEVIIVPDIQREVYITLALIQVKVKTPFRKVLNHSCMMYEGLSRFKYH